MRTFLFGLFVVGGLLGTAGVANADHRHYYGGNYHNHGYYRPYNYSYYRPYNYGYYGYSRPYYNTYYYPRYYAYPAYGYGYYQPYYYGYPQGSVSFYGPRFGVSIGY